MSPYSNSKPPSARTFWLVWLTVIALSTASFFGLFRFGPLGAKATPFRRTAHGFEKLPAFASVVYDIHVSDRGVVWTRTWRGLCRLEGASWHQFSAADFGVEHGDVARAFTLDGEEVWGAGIEAIVHFDGKTWRSYPYPFAMADAASIAAAHGRVWLVDLHGNLTHFDGAAWTTSKLDLRAVRWNLASRRHTPHLAVTSNGALWLVFQGLWRNDGKSWTRIAGPSAEAEFLGVTSSGSYIAQGKTIETDGALWLRDGAEVIGFNVDGVEWARYTMSQLGLLDSTRTYAVAGRPPTFAVASSQGLTWFDGSEWHPEQPSSVGVASVTSVAVAPDQSLWAIGYAPTSASSGAPLVRIAAIGFLIFPLVAFVYPIWWFRRRARYQRQAAREAVLHATGSLPESMQTPEPSGWKTGVGVITILVVTGGGYWLLKQYWPAAPVWLMPLFFIAIHVIGTVTGSLKKRKPLPSDPIGPGGPPRYDWGKSLPTILGGLAVIVLLYGNSIARYLHIPWLAAVPGIVLLLGGQFLFGAYEHLRVRPINRELAAGHYARAFQLLNGPLSWPSTGSWKNAWGEVLFFSGRAAEAEPILRELMEIQRDPTLRSMALDDLGRVLIAQRRYDEAKRAFEASAKLTPTRSRSYSGLAELRLLQGVEPQQALEDAERALQNQRKVVAQRKGAREYFADIRGNQVWALGILGRGAEAQKAIDDGLQEIDARHKPALAGFYWRAGMAMVALGNTTTAVAHFRRSAELDPDGYYGKLSARQLSEHSVWGAVGITSAYR